MCHPRYACRTIANNNLSPALRLPGRVSATLEVWLDHVGLLRLGVPPV